MPHLRMALMLYKPGIMGILDVLLVVRCLYGTILFQSDTPNAHFGFRHTDSTISLLLKLLACFCDCTVDLCQTWSETPKTDFLASRPIL